MYCGTHALLSLGLACLASHVICPVLIVTALCKSDVWVWSKLLCDHPLWCSSWVLDPWEFLQTTPQAFRKSRGTRDQIANIHWIIEKAREFQKNIYFCIIDYAKAFDCVDQNKLWKILKETGIPDHLTCLLRNLYAGQEATAKTRNGTTDWFQIGKGVRQGCVLSPCLFTLYAEFIMWNECICTG